MQVDDRRQVDLRQHVAVEDHDRLRQVGACVLHRTRGAEWCRFYDVPDRDAQSGPVTEDLLDSLRLIIQAQDDLVDLWNLLEKVDLVLEKGPVEDRHDRLRSMNRERPQASSFATGQKDRLHDNQRSYSMIELAASMNLPNALTLVRMFLVPLLVVVLLTEFEGRRILGVPKELVGAAIFALASMTDWLDGYLARRRRQVTPLGQMLDPIADKLLTSAAFISLVQLDLAPAWMVALIIGREFADHGAAELRAHPGHHDCRLRHSARLRWHRR